MQIQYNRTSTDTSELIELLKEIMEPFKNISYDNLLLEWQRKARDIIEENT